MIVPHLCATGLWTTYETFCSWILVIGSFCCIWTFQTIIWLLKWQNIHFWVNYS